MTFESKKSGTKKIVCRIAAALMVSAAPFAMAEKAGAQTVGTCTPPTSAANPVNNTTVTCTGGTITANGNAGYGTGAEQDNQITVDSTATVTGAGQGFLLGDVNTITNNGTIEASGANGIAVNAATPGAFVTVSNSKTIQATASGGTAIKASQVFLFNAATGTISADSVAVNATGLIGSSVGTVGNNRGNFGLIEATGAAGIAIKSAADVNINNSGTIQAKAAGGIAIKPAGKAIVHNLVGGTITGGANGISAATLDVTNNGTISGGNIGITGSGSITNSGTISGGTGGGNGAVVFTGGAGATNTLTLQTGSKLTGDVVGSTAGATNNLVLQGSGTADNNFLHFNSLDMSGSLWTLNGNSDVGSATLNSGTLALGAGAILTGNVTVNSSAQLTGGGQVSGNVNVMDKARLTPGAGVGKLTITGNLSFASGSILFINATPTSATSVSVGGKAVLAGSVSVQTPGTFTALTKYTILTATGGFGTTRFDGVANVDSSSFVRPTLSYDATNTIVSLTLDLISGRGTGGGAGFGFASAAQTRNQVAVATALDAAPTSNSLVGKLLMLSADGARAAFDALSGEIFGSVHNTQAQEGSFTRSGVLGRLRQASYADAPGELGALGFAGPELAYADGRAASGPTSGSAPSSADGRLAYAADANGSVPVKAPRGGNYNAGHDLTFWAQGLGGWGHSDSDGNAASLKSRFGGFLSGADMRFGQAWRAGLVAGYTRSDLKADARGSSAGIDSVTLGLYAGGRLGAFNLRSGASFSYDSIDASRAVSFPGFSDSTKAHFHGQVGQLFGEIGYGMGLGTFAIEPFAGLAYVHLHDGSFLESGGIAALSGSGAHEDIGYSSLGIRAATFLPLGNGTVLVPRASAQWQHAFGDVTPTTALAFQSMGTAFTVAGIPIARDSALVETGLDWRLSPWTKLGAFYQGELAAHAQSHAVKGGFTLDF